MGTDTLKVNRAPVLALWAAVVAERAGHDRSAALTLGKVLAGLNAQSKGRALGIFGAPKGDGSSPETRKPRGEDTWVMLLGRPVPARQTPDGLRAVIGEDPLDPGAVEEYLGRAFGDRLPDVRRSMEQLASSFERQELGERAWSLYERFRPVIASGTRGWGQKGDLDLDLVRGLARSPHGN